MLRQMMISAFLIGGLLIAALPLQASSSLTNNDVVTLAKAGLGDETIIAAIQAQDASFDISVPALLRLKQDGVTPNVLRAMITAMSKNRAAASTSPSGAPIANAAQDRENSPKELDDLGPATFQAPSSSASRKSWLKAFATAAQKAMSSAGANIADGTGRVGGSFKNSFESVFSNVGNQSNAYVTGTPYQDGPGGNAYALSPQGQASNYYASAYSGGAAMGNPTQASWGSMQPASFGMPDARRGSQGQVAFVPWRDPREGAFTMNIPRGWKVAGGTARTSAMDPHPFVLAVSPDRKIQLFYGDPNLTAREVPNRLTAMARMRDGQMIRASWGGPIMLARYQTGDQFTRDYVGAQLCRTPQITSSGILQDASRRLTMAAIAYGRAQGAPAQASVGETNFRCGAQAGYVRASTVLAGSATGQGIGIWVAMEVTGFLADPSEAAMARYILNTMAGSFQLDPQWEARQARTTRDVTGAVTRAQQQMAAVIAQNARQQSQSSHIDVMSGWENKNKVMDGVMQRDSDARLGITTVTDDVTGSHTVSNDYNYYWTRPDGTIRGTNTDTPPDYSTGWRPMSNNQ